MNPIRYQHFILNTNVYEKDFLRHLLNNYSEFDVFYTDEGTFKLQRGGFNIIFQMYELEDQIFVELDVSDELANLYCEYVDFEVPNKNIYIYPVTKSYDFTTLKFNYSDNNYKKIFHNILEVLIKQQIDLEQSFYEEITKERSKKILFILSSSAIVSVAVFLYLYDYLRDNNLDNISFLIIFHLILFAPWKYIDEKIYFLKNKNL